MPHPSTPLHTLFLEASRSLTGLRDWPDLIGLGRDNLERLHRRARTGVMADVTSGSLSADERAGVGVAVAHLAALAAAETEDLPVLPPLRAEHFHVGDEVVVYGGDTPHGPAGWVPGQVVHVSKANRVGWKGDPKTRGFYWRVGISTARPIVRGAEVVYISTTEPRVLPVAEAEALRALFYARPRFVAAFIEASRRDWVPLWCIEHGLELTGPPNPAAWILDLLRPPAAPRTWAVGRTDDHGNEVIIETGLPAEEAARRFCALEARGHKQMYWIVDG